MSFAFIVAPYFVLFVGPRSVWVTDGIHCAEPSAQQRERGHSGIHLLWRDFVAAGSNW